MAPFDASTPAPLRTAAPAGRSPGASRPGTPVYHCYRYDQAAHGRPTDAGGAALPLPATARLWYQRPWCRYEAAAFFGADLAITWLGEQLRTAASSMAAAVPDAVQRLSAQWRACQEALNSRDSACHTSACCPEGNVLAWAIVAVWDRSATHPLLRQAAAGPDRSAS